MCGIAGAVDLAGQRPVPEGVVRRMADALIHRGPDDDGMIELPGATIASRRLNIVGIENGRQPFANETGNAHVVFNGELFDHDAERNARISLV